MGVSSAVDPNAVARVVGIETKFVNLNEAGGVILPQSIAVFGQGNELTVYSTDKKTVTSALEVANTYGFGSPLHQAAQMLYPTNGDGVGTIPVHIYPLVARSGSVAASGNVAITGTPTKTAAYQARVNNILSAPFVIETGESIASAVAKMTAAVNSTLEMPVIAADGATQVDLTAKWKGLTSNDVHVEIIGDATAGLTFTTTQLTGGLLSSELTDALAQMGNVWETVAVNCLGYDDAAVLNEIENFGQLRWGATVKKPLMFFSGTGEADYTVVAAKTDARPNDRINGLIPVPGSVDLPTSIAARAVARIAKLANENAPHDYARQTLTGLTPGSDAQQWDFIKKNTAVVAGSSTTDSVDGVAILSDTITNYHPTGDNNPAYRYVVDIVKLQNIIFNLDLIFNSADWDGAPLIPDDQPTVNPKAKQPKAAKAAVAELLDSLGLQAIISDPKTAKKNILAEIDPQNPKRLNVRVTLQLSGNVNIVSVDLLFGFFFGTPTVQA